MAKSIIFDFGGMSPADVNRVQRELKEQSYAQLSMNAELNHIANSIGGDFLKFLESAFRNLGLIDRIGLMANPYTPVAADNRYGDSPTEVMRQAWNNRAHNWGVVETPANYAVTMQTILEFLKASGKPETFLSLGSGPGFYETYLAYLFQGAGIENIKIVAVDYAKEMTRRHQEVINSLYTAKKEGQPMRKLKNIEAVTGDMTNLKFASGSIDQIICNNSLQWTSDWRKTIAEMARVMNPNGIGWLYLFVHTHPMAVLGGDGKIAFRLGEFQIPELLDALETHRFSPKHMRQIAGARGTGQAGTQTSRVFIHAQFCATGEMTSWRDAKVSSRIGSVRI